ncbi:hypothetical protein [Pseudomonas alkylphenolica]|uniref:hypothetical protein n=1 Tax=Pseudomonas alkylphenolica TaxID=237609 RepID=UPI000FEB9CE4|nr:hypothetical protein [Pseudomonas alkylphenolica]
MNTSEFKLFVENERKKLLANQNFSRAKEVGKRKPGHPPVRLRNWLCTRAFTAALGVEILVRDGQTYAQAIATISGIFHYSTRQVERFRRKARSIHVVGQPMASWKPLENYQPWSAHPFPPATTKTPQQTRPNEVDGEQP